MVYKINLKVKKDTTNSFSKNAPRTEETYWCSIYTDRPIRDVHKVVGETRKKMGSSVSEVIITGVDFMHDDYLVKGAENE